MIDWFDVAILGVAAGAGVVLTYLGAEAVRRRSRKVQRRPPPLRWQEPSGPAVSWPSVLLLVALLAVTVALSVIEGC